MPVQQSRSMEQLGRCQHHRYGQVSRLRDFLATWSLHQTGIRDTTADSEEGPLVLGTSIGTTLVLFKDLLIPTRAREAEDGFPASSRVDDLEARLKARRLRMADDSEVVTITMTGQVGYIDTDRDPALKY